MKPVKRQFKVKDKMAGFVYTVIASNKTHYLAIDNTGCEVTISKLQTYRI